MKLDEIKKLSLIELVTYKSEARQLAEISERMGINAQGMGTSYADKKSRMDFNKWRNVYKALEDEMITRLESFITSDQVNKQ